MVDVPTGFVPTEKLPVVEPAVTTIEDGIVFTAVAPLTTASATLVSAITATGNVTVPVVVPPPVSEFGENTSEERAFPSIVKLVYFMVPFTEAEVFNWRVS